VIDPHQGQISKLLSRLMAKRRLNRRRTDCPDEEELASYLDGVLAETQRAQVESHLSDCSACLAEVCAAYKTSSEGRKDTVPQRILERAMAIILADKGGDKNFLNVVVQLALDCLKLVSTSGELIPAEAPAGIRGKDKESDAAVLQVEKELDQCTVAMEVERIERELCQVAVTVKPKQGMVAGGIRLSLLCGEREQASYLASQGTAIFERVPPGDYKLNVSDSGHSVGSIRLTIKENQDER
jgi:hypothetical protein